MKGRVVNSLFLIVCLMIGNSQAVANSPEAVIKQTTDGVLSRIEAQRSALEANPEQVYALVNELVIPHFDFPSMSRWVLGKSWKTASEEQRSDFMEQFKTLLVRTYARALLEYSGQEIKYLPVEQSPKPHLATVKTMMKSSGAQAFPIHYRMYQKDEEWKVIDISVDGVSLVATYRGSFATQIKKNGLDALIKQLIDKNAKLARSFSH